MLLIKILKKSIYLTTIFLFVTLSSTSVYADAKTSFAMNLRNGVYIIDNAYWRNNDLLVFIEVSNTWSGADTYSTAELICKKLDDQGLRKGSGYSVVMVEKTAQSQLLKLRCN